MATTFTVPEGYGYTVLIALGLIPLLAQIQGVVVTSARKDAQVPYPNQYATPDQAKNNQAAYRFNCAQRAHGNLLENMPQAIASLLVAGIIYPTATPILGFLWVVLRAVYAYGYITSSKPQGKGRIYGSGFWLVQMCLNGLCFAAAFKMM